MTEFNGKRAERRLLVLTVLLAALAVRGPQSWAQDYILGEGDVISITVYEQPDLRTTARISGDGMITLPLLGRISAADMSVKELSADLEARLADGYLVAPHVAIFIEEFRSRKVTILGEVKAPGIYEIKSQTTLLELISQADGLTRDAADQAVIQRRRGNEGDAESITVDLTQLMEKGRASQNIDVTDGDSVYIPRKKVFYVSGQVKKPDVYNFEKGLTVIKALTMAGGVNDKAAADRINIIRTRDGRERLIKSVRMDMRVQPDDVIVVPESYF